VRRAQSFSLTLLSLAGGALLVLAARAEPPALDPARPRPMDLAAGAEECARCHGDVHASWCVSTHALTVREAAEEVLVADIRAGAEVRHGPGRTRFVRQGSRVAAETLGPTGALERYDLTHVVGKTRIEMLVTTLPDGRKQVLPAMREHETGVWFDYTALYFSGPGGDARVPPLVAPGEPSYWTGPVRSWDAQCSRCHLSGREPREPAADGTGPRTAQRAYGLDCEACHGPSASHARHHDESREGPDPIVRLRALPRRAQVDACLVCHMESEEIVPGWHPGESRDLLEFLDPSLLDDPDRVDPAGRPLELVYAGVSFWSSRCAEEGGLTCATCHDPHGGPNRSAMRHAPRDDAQCARCHQEIVAAPAAHSHHAAGSEGARCVNCHMPFLTVERGHGAITDHTIGIPRPTLQGDRVAQNACAWCHLGGRAAPPGAPPLSEAGIRVAHARWWPDAQPPPAWLTALVAGRRGEYDALERLQALLADRSAPRFARATVPVLLTRLGPAARDALLAHAADPDSLVRRRVADGLVHVERPEAWTALGQLLEDESAPVRAHASRSALLAPGRLAADLPLLARVIVELEAQTRWTPDDDWRWERLADAYALAGETQKELESVRRLRRLDPDRVAVREREGRLVLRLAESAGR